MKNMAVVLCMLMAAVPAAADEQVFRGRIGTENIEMVLQSGNALYEGVYMYERHRTPIALNPRIINRFVDYGIDELDEQGLPRARFVFRRPVFSRQVFADRRNGAASGPDVTGKWHDYRDGRAVDFELTLMSYVSHDEIVSDGPMELLQQASTPEHFFRIPIHREGQRIERILVLSKASGEQVQSLILPQPACYGGIRTLRIGEGGTPEVTGRFSNCPRYQLDYDAASGQFSVQTVNAAP